MKLSIGSQFSREFSWEDRTISLDFSNYLNEYFLNKNYGDIFIIYVSALCVSEGFKPFFKLKKNKYTKSTKTLEYEFDIDFDNFFKLSHDGKIGLLINKFYEKTESVLLEFKDKIEFQRDEFLLDLKRLVKEYNA
ncbi:hypothetical protein [Flavobacterium sp.]|uniref:hypothetical protein n=1 Tax=Flavobacterium sp. TaxID=239 RepID=UPI003A94B175